MRQKPEKPLHFAQPDLEPDDSVPAERTAIEKRMSGHGTQQRTRWWHRKSTKSAKEIFVDHVDLIARVAKSAARRAGFSKEDAEDFHSKVNVKLISDNYAVLQKHRGESSVATFLTVVINNQLRDFRNHKLGKFRYSAKAIKLGETAKALELLIARDGHKPETAIDMLKRQRKLEETPHELLQLVDQLPRRPPPRRFVGEETLEQAQHALPQSDTEHRVVDAEREALARDVTRILNLALKTLSPEDLLILKMHYRDGCKISTIATTLKLEQRPLYNRRAKCLAALERVLEAEGLTWEKVRETLGWHGEDLQANFGDEHSEQGDSTHLSDNKTKSESKAPDQDESPGSGPSK